jgi:aryl-alcohol dehydrogenase-like predicted oxidoreductase
MSEFSRRQLGKTALQVSPLGIGGGNGLESRDLLYAFERGINYFFFSSDLHHVNYQRSAEALRTLCGKGSSVRDQVVLATVSYMDDPSKLVATMLDQFGELGIDYIDVFHWGWILAEHDVAKLLSSARELREGGSATMQYRMLEVLEQAQSINAELLQRGLARYVGMSFHSLHAACSVIDEIDVMMLRYNLANTRAEQQIVPLLSGDKNSDPGIVVFNTAHEGIFRLHMPPPGYPDGLPVPSVPDCYRFALSQPWVDVVLTGVTNRQEIDLALAALQQGPLSEDEIAFFREYGTLFELQNLAQNSWFPSLQMSTSK